MSDYSELKKRAMDATPGPWYEQDDEDSAAGAVFIMPTSDVWAPPICRITTEANAAYVAAANPAAVLALIAENNSNACRLEVSEDTLAVIRGCLRTAEEEIDQLKADLVTFKGGISALGAACKRLALCALATRGAAEPNQGIRDSCDAVKAALSLGGVSKAIDYIQGLEAEIAEIRNKYEAARDRKNSITLLKMQCDELRAENAGLKTGYQAYERVNAELKAEMEALRKRIFSGAPLTGPDTKCLACGGYHSGLGGLPCPKMSTVAQALSMENQRVTPIEPIRVPHPLETAMAQGEQS